MEVPRCPDPAHVGGRVVRAGWYGRPPHRRPRWLCRAAGREHARMTGPGGRLRDPNLDGQLVANWVDSLAAIVTAGELPQRWPERLALDSREFRIDRGPRAGQSFHVFCAVGHDEPGRPRVWRMAAFPRRTEANWQQFLSLCAGTPRLVVSDFDKALRKALAGVFPRAGEAAPELRLCELHLRRSLENALAPLEGEPDHPVARAFRHALFDHDNWARFEAQARASHQDARPPLPALARWLDNYAEIVASQLETRSSLGPNSIGAVEAALRQVDRAFQGRSQGFGNRRRLNLLLDLMTLHAGGQADPRRWADQLRERLHPRGGIAPHQRPHDDRRG